MLEVIDLVTNEKFSINDIVDYNVPEGHPIHIISENPSKNDLVILHLLTGIPVDDLNDALDIDEQPRVEDELDGEPSYIKLVLRVPAVGESELLGFQKETTYPMIIYLMEQIIVTVQPPFVPTKVRKKRGDMRAFDVATQATIGILADVVTAYENAVDVVDKTLDIVENDIFRATFRYRDSMRKVFQLARSGTYLDAALNANLSALRRMTRLKIYQDQPEVLEKFEDVIIDLTQQQELLVIYKKLIENSIDGFASVVNNNQNDLLKLLASISLILTIPTTLSSLYGMNVHLPLQDSPWAFWLIIGLSLVLIVPTLVLLRRLTLL